METRPTASTSSVATGTVPEPGKEPPKTNTEADVAMETAPSDPSQPRLKSVTGEKLQPKSLFSEDEEKPSSSADSESGKKAVTNDFLSPLFTNWPCIVTTVLGCYPLARGIGKLGSPFVDWPSQNEELSSVQSVDSFTSHLIWNCDEALVERFTSTIVEKINSCLVESNQRSLDLLDLSVHDVDVRLIDVRVLPILVGRRFLESVIRVLGMEHSRVKNTFAEMQQLRARSSAGGGGEGPTGRADGGREGGRRGLRSENGGNDNSSVATRNIVKVTK